MSVFWRVWATFDTRMARLTKFIQLYDHETETEILCTRIFAVNAKLVLITKIFIKKL